MDVQPESLNTRSLTSWFSPPAPHPNLILGSLHLLFWLFFHPTAWRHYLARIEPALSPGFTLLEVTGSFNSNPRLRRVLIQALIILPFLASWPVALALWLRGTPLDRSLVVPVLFVLAINLSLAFMTGAVISVAAGMVAGASVGLAYGLVASVTTEPLGSIATPVAMSLAIGATGSIAALVAGQRSPLEPRYRTGLQLQVGSIVVGVLVGVVVVAGVRLGLTSLASLATGLTESSAYWLARSLVVGISFGVAAGLRRGRRAGLLDGGVVGLLYGVAVTGIQTQFFQRTGFLVDSGLAIGLASGLLFGTSFGVTVVLPYVLSEKMAGPWAGAVAGALGSWGRHIFRNQAPLWPTLPLGLSGILLGLTHIWWRSPLLYPFQAAWNLILYRIDLRRTGREPSLFRWNAAFWDEFQRLPLTGLDDHLLLVLERNWSEGQAALAYLSTSRQRWAAQAVQIELEARRLAAPVNITDLAHLHRHLAPGELSGPAQTLLRQFSHLSQDIEAALNQTSHYHQRLALSAIDDRLNSLERELTITSLPYATRFYPIARQWRQLVADHLQGLTQAAEGSQEIDNPYIVGVPLTARQEIFVGRTDIVARIEQLLLDPRRPPLLLYGQRRMGKTSLLRNLGRLLPRSIVPLFVDGQRVALAGDYADFLYNLASEMTRSARQQRHLALPPVRYETLTPNPFTCFNEWLDGVEQSLREQGYKTALLALDEFEMLDSALARGRFDETDLLSMVRHMIQHRAGFKVMLAGSHPLAEFHRWASYLINVQVVKIGYLAPDEARHLIERPIKNYPLLYQPQASQRVLELTRGHPALTQLLCYEIVTLKNEQKPASRWRVDRSDVEAAIPRALNSGSFFFADIEQNQVDQAGLHLLRELAACGEGAAALRRPGPIELDPPLQHLLQRDLIEPADGGYRFQVELIRRWFARPR
jgi:hypothetical protein